MNRAGRATVIFCCGLIVARLLWSGGFGWFVQQRMRIPLLLAAFALPIFGVVELWMAWREESREPDATEKSRGPLVGWLLVLPLLVLIAVAPTGLGAAAADRVDAYTPTESDGGFEPLDSSAQPIELRVFDFLDRAVWDENRSLEDVTVRLEGLVVNDPDHPDGFTLTRFLVSCCAADGIPLQVDLYDVGQRFENDTWVVADVRWIPPETPYNELARADRRIAASVVEVRAVPGDRKDPYESPY